MVTGHIGGVHSRLLRREWRAFARTAESKRAGALPGEHIPRLIANGHNGVIERGLNVHHAVRNVACRDVLAGGFDVRALIVEEDVRAECAQEFTLVETAEEQDAERDRSGLAPA